MLKQTLLASLLIGGTLSLPAHAKLYKWVDNNGVTHYGETIPPEYANKNHVELSKGWRVKQDERKTQQPASVKHQEAELNIEQKRRDSALLNTYANEAEIDLAQERNLEQVNAKISSITAEARIYTERFERLKKEQDDFTSAGKKTPPSLSEDLKETRARLSRIEENLTRSNNDRDALKQRFQEDKIRFRELKGP